jgi:hypothetical protein
MRRTSSRRSPLRCERHGRIATLDIGEFLDRADNLLCFGLPASGKATAPQHSGTPR